MSKLWMVIAGAAVVVAIGIAYLLLSKKEPEVVAPSSEIFDNMGMSEEPIPEPSVEEGDGVEPTPETTGTEEVPVFTTVKSKHGTSFTIVVEDAPEPTIVEEVPETEEVPSVVLEETQEEPKMTTNSNQVEIERDTIEFEIRGKKVVKESFGSVVLESVTASEVKEDDDEGVIKLPPLDRDLLINLVGGIPKERYAKVINRFKPTGSRADIAVNELFDIELFTNDAIFWLRSIQSFAMVMSDSKTNDKAYTARVKQIKKFVDDMYKGEVSEEGMKRLFDSIAYCLSNNTEYFIALSKNRRNRPSHA